MEKKNILVKKVLTREGNTKENNCPSPLTKKNIKVTAKNTSRTKSSKDNSLKKENSIDKKEMIRIKQQVESIWVNFLSLKFQTNSKEKVPDQLNQVETKFKSLLNQYGIVKGQNLILKSLKENSTKETKFILSIGKVWIIHVNILFYKYNITLEELLSIYNTIFSNHLISEDGINQIYFNFKELLKENNISRQVIENLKLEQNFPKEFISRKENLNENKCISQRCKTPVPKVRNFKQKIKKKMSLNMADVKVLTRKEDGIENYAILELKGRSLKKVKHRFLLTPLKEKVNFEEAQREIKVLNEKFENSLYEPYSPEMVSKINKKINSRFTFGKEEVLKK